MNGRGEHMKKTIVVVATIILALMMLVSIIACGSGGDVGAGGGSTPSTSTGQPSSTGGSSTPSSSAGSEPAELRGPDGQEYGGTFKMATSATLQEPFGVPWLYVSFNRPTWPYGETLLKETPYGDFHPYLAESWTVDVKKPEIVFKLYEGITFHDGSPCNAEAVAWNVNKWVDEGMADTAIIGAEVRSELEVAFLLNEWSNSMYSVGASRGNTIVSMESYEKNGGEYSARTAVGTGPFILDEWQPGLSVTFNRNDNYWKEGMPFLDRFEIYSITDIMTQNAALLSNGPDAIDFFFTSTAEQIALFIDNPDFYVTSVSTGAMCLMPSSMNPESPLSKKEIREAVSYAIDREGIAGARGFGIYKPGTQLIPDGFPGHLPASHDLKYDPEKAREIMAQAGYPNGFSTTLYRTTGDVDAMVAVQDMLQQVGIDCAFERPEAGAATAMRYDGWSDGLMTNGIRPFACILQIWWFNFEETYYYFPSTWRPKEMTDAYALARVTPEVETPRVEQLHQMVLDDVLLIPVYYSYEGHIHKNNVHDTGWSIWGPGTLFTPYTIWKSK